MFCPSCGIEYAIELNYCNRCGANLSTALSVQPEAIPVNVTKPILVIGITLLLLTLGGFAGLISGAIELTRAAGGGDLSMAIIFFGMITIMIVDIFLVRLLSRLINASLSPNKLPMPKRSKALAPPESEIPRMTPARLDGAASVTENTTRFFEPYHASAQVADFTPADKLKS